MLFSGVCESLKIAIRETELIHLPRCVKSGACVGTMNIVQRGAFPKSITTPNAYGEVLMLLGTYEKDFENVLDICAGSKTLTLDTTIIRGY